MYRRTLIQPQMVLLEPLAKAPKHGRIDDFRGGPVGLQANPVVIGKIGRIEPDRKRVEERRFGFCRCFHFDA